MAIAYQNRLASLDITPLMTPERIVGILIWAISRGVFTDEIFALADQIPMEYINQLEDDVNTMVHMLKTSRRDIQPEIRKAVYQGVLGELKSTLKLKGTTP